MADSPINDSICPEEGAVREALSGRFPETEVARLLAHAERCPSCSLLLVRSGTLSSSEEEPTNVVDSPAPLAAETPPEEVLPRGAVVGRYMVLEKLGAGGMGVVYAAYDPELDRKLALKLLHPGSEQVEKSGGQARLMREAQALARLAHPNVISIFDVGTWSGRVFLAMELVEGPSLRDWLKQGPRAWREVVDVFSAAGRGLAAAHAAGLVHRDFKPDNVLLGKDGRVRVLDFGLARPASATGESLPALGELDLSERGSPLDTPLTRVGLVIGTPAYMAPELYSGGVLDARSDQFSYCVALYEALYGERPHGRTPGPPSTWRTPEPPRDARVPASLRRLVLRGLEPQPEQRFPSMEALLEALGQTLPMSQRPWLVAAASLLLLSLGVGLPLQYRAQAEQPCRGGARHLEGLWDSARKESLGKAFHATGKSNADESWSRTAQVLDSYAQGWVSMHTEACEATRVRGEQSDEVLSLRMACLERRLHALQALTDVYSRADAALVDQAAKAAHALPTLDGCANVEALRATIRPPEDPATREKVGQLRLRLAEARALFDSGQFKPALERIRTLAGDAVALRYRPLESEVLELRGALEEKAGDFPASEATLRQAVWAAEAGRHDEVIASASARLVRSGMLQAEFEQGREWAEHTRAVLERMGGDDRIEAFVTNALGAILLREDRMEESLEHFRRVVALRQKVYPAEHPEVAAGFNNLGAALTKLRRYEEARQQLVQAQAIYEKALGPTHPETGNALHNLGRLSQHLADDAAALRYLRASLTARETGLGPEHPEVAATVGSMGDSYCDLRQYAECLASSERSMAIRTKAFGPKHTEISASVRRVAEALEGLGRKSEALVRFQESLRGSESVEPPYAPDVIAALVELAGALRARGRRAEALPHLQRALALAEKEMGKDAFETATALEGLGAWHLEGGQHRQALVHYQRALAIREKDSPPGHPDLFEPLAGVGRSQVALNAPAEAVAPLERALALAGSPRIAPETAADLRFLLARALWDAGTGRERARELATRAREVLLQAHQAPAASQVTAWLESHGGP
ncbi:serine/threonine protein kinase [Archangium gephyra]|uniref:Serine/threonine kinase family protein n=1 Tax=Archangium gephyra TaxID=48 RepID=A0AAC8TF17_9BACT|nr:serine/threonine-protein kinase [Archangium gephyra]AKJ02101.1 serine/threonine kinase family protein [Archangium gephyra]REG28968.1 serine/threonine protein kinase [Archangium gephyra]